MLHERLADVVGPRYALERELPGGGMSRVFLAHDPRLDRRVVIKVLPPERATAIGMERFQREARLLARLNHPHIIPILDSGHDHAMPWFAMPWIEGQTLAARLTEGPLPEEEAKALALELLDALSHAHRLGVVHRDIKPGNVFLHAGHALLADFGVAAIADSTGDTLTESGVVVGTLGYMSPEHRQSGQGNPRSDVWELAATVYEACTGTRWTATTDDRDRWTNVPPGMQGVLRRALADRPADRWSSAEEFREALLPRARRTRRPMLLTAAVGTLALVAVWQQLPGRVSEPPVTTREVDLLFVPGPGAAPFVREVIRDASLSLEWLPMIRSAVADSAQSGASGASVEVSSTLVGADTVLLLVARDANGGLINERRVVGSVADAESWSREVADQVVGMVHPGRLSDFRMLANSTNDVQALHAWYRGSEAFQAARWEEAEAHFTHALQRDPGFLAASWSRLLTAMWRREPYDAELRLLISRAADLPPALRELVEAQVEPHLPTRMARFDVAATTYPDFAAAQMLRANELFHRGPLIGRSLQEGVDAFIAAARAVPDLDHRTTWQHVLWGATRLGDEATARAAWQRLSQWPGDVELNTFLGMGLDARFSRHGATARRGLLQFFATGSRLESMSRYLRLGLDFDIPREVQRMAAAVADRSTDAEAVAAARATQATTLLMQGRVADALAMLDRAAGVAAEPLPYALQAAEWRVLLPVIGIPVDSLQQVQAQARLVALAGDRRHWPRAVWALAMTGDGATRGTWGDSLRRGSRHHPLAEHLLPLWRAHDLAGTVGAVGALAESNAIHRDPGDAMVVARGPLARAITYMARGHWQLQLADSAAADREWRWHENNDLQGWPSGPPQDGELDAALSVPARLLRATLLCAGGQTQRGRQLLDRAVVLWARADDALGPDWSTRRDAERACR